MPDACTARSLPRPAWTQNSSPCPTPTVRSRSSWWMAAGSGPCFAARTSASSSSLKIFAREWIVNARALHLDGCEIAAATQAAAWARACRHSRHRRPRRNLSRSRAPHRERRLPHRQPGFSRPPDRRKAIWRRPCAASRSRYGCSPDRRDAGRGGRALPGTGAASICGRPIAFRSSIPPAPETSSTPGSFSACCKGGRSSANSTLPALPRH